jgi:DNA-directed RNA polymerase specialized sigma subunit
MDPVSEFIEFSGGFHKEAVSKEQRDQELEMWHTWNNNGRKQEDMRPLLNSMRPLILKEANNWARQRDVPPAAIRAEFTNQAVRGFETYDPTKAALNTHLRNQMLQARRFVVSNQNPARIVESRVYGIGDFNNAKQRLADTLGRDPTQLELADELKWSPRKVKMMQSEIKVAVPASQFSADVASMVPSRQQEILRLLPYELTPDERAVFEHIYGIGGKAKLSPGEIAVKLNMSAPKVSRLKASIAAKYEGYIK